MSLIVLKSQRTLQNADGSTTVLSGNSPAEFQCDFREAIKLEDGQQIQVVSATFHKDPAFVVDGNNDTLVWRISGTTSDRRRGQDWRRLAAGGFGRAGRPQHDPGRQPGCR